MHEQESFDFNFWASFADIMLSFVLILVLLISVVMISLTIGKVNLDKAKASQKNIVDLVARHYEAEVSEISGVTDAYGIKLKGKTGGGKDKNDIEFYNDLDKQRITFSEWILFEKKESELKKEGKEILAVVGDVVKSRLDDIKQIQIEGHADPDGSEKDPNYNLNLASRRAIEVFIFLRDTVKISPVENVMSATSFGEYNPVQRVRKPEAYNESRFRDDNKDEPLKTKNRRIEIVLFYKR